MKTKKTANIVLSILLSLFMAFSTAAAPVMMVQAEEMVLVTKTGSKYHKRKCGNGTYTSSTLSAAKARGLTPCENVLGMEELLHLQTVNQLPCLMRQIRNQMLQPMREMGKQQQAQPLLLTSLEDLMDVKAYQ